ncbi:Zinc transporter 6-A [Trichinella pseudospiralis]|uniref:Zinc transporter 6-A n=1 Tax=Trichinella pseudospiralis TaxID=6337 RepID=A0A0V1K3N8_TRIPS|nr:Zinc transporter 6-A [Trichinella pseudospiralis]
MYRLYRRALAWPQGRLNLGSAVLSAVCFVVILFTVSYTKSLMLQIYSLMCIFHCMSLLLDLLVAALNSDHGHRMIVNGKSTITTNNINTSYGYERADVVGLFSITMLVQLGALFVVKESFEQLLESHHDGSLLVSNFWLVLAPSLALLTQLYIIYAVPSASLAHVITASSSSWLQEQAADFSHALCRVLPVFSAFLLPRINTVNYSKCDAAFCLLYATMLIGTMYPLAVYTGGILLQSCPPYMLPQLEKCLRECGTLDGVLEVTDEHFWQLSFNKMAGSLLVRVRRDADEQLVLARVCAKLHPFVSNLTVQVVKDTAWKAQQHQLHF